MNYFLTTGPNFYLKVSLDSVYQDQHFLFGGIFLGVAPRDTIKESYTLNLNNFSNESFIFDLNVSLERVYQDLNHCLCGNPLGD